VIQPARCTDPEASVVANEACEPTAEKASAVTEATPSAKGYQEQRPRSRAEGRAATGKWSRPASACPGSASGAALRSGSEPRLSRARFDGVRIAPAFGLDKVGKARSRASSSAARSGSNFVEEYERGALPCRIDHHTCSHRVSWSIAGQELVDRRAALMPLCAQGLRETRHPYATLARLAFESLAALPGVTALPSASLRETMVALRSALQPGESEEVASVAMLALHQVAEAEEERLVPHLTLVLPALGRRLFSKNAKERGAVKELLRHFADRCGEEAKKAMRARGCAAGLS